MKLLLTSAGITNDSIKKSFFDLVGKKPEDISLAFIPTASNVETGDKDWLEEDLIRLKNLNLKSISVVDISAVPESVWRPQLEESDVLFFEGGNSFYLMEWINKSGLSLILTELLKTKVYVGVSAGSMVASRDLLLNLSQKLYEEDLDRTEEMEGLSFVNFYILPHLNSMFFTNVVEENIKLLGMKEKIYALDDMSAIVVEGDKIDISSEGKYLELN